MKNNSISIILSNPQMGENIGAAARSMQNFGLSDLRLVNPRDGWPNTQAITMSSGALERIGEVKIFDTLSQAIADLHFCFATTARKRDMIKPEFNPENAIKESIKRINNKQNIGIVFGAERTGLLNEEISLCQAIISIPANPEFSSLNLGQAVLLIAYEWGKQKQKNTDDLLSLTDMGDSFPAKQGDVKLFLERLEKELEASNFFRSEDLKPTMVKNIQNIFTRSDISDQEIRTLHGVLSALRGNKIIKSKTEEGS